jgi:ubiquitin carboxyl-terminal hydrolase 5/13
MPDDTIVAQLVSMGFSENGSKRAALAVGNSGAEAATEWVFAHMEDPDFNDPLPAPGQQQAAAAGGAAGGAAAAAAAAGPSAESLEMLGSMGFSERQARGALAACQGSLERATDWLLSHLDDMEAAVEAALASPAGGAFKGRLLLGGGLHACCQWNGLAGGSCTWDADVSSPWLPADGSGAAAAAPTAPVAAAGASGATAPLLDGPGKYELAGIISHMGANTACGHYVCHIRGPDGRWALFNDEKVAASEQPPFDLGYLYLYRRAQQ